MKRRDTLLSIIAFCGDREDFGRTSLQKVCYFVAVVLGGDFQHRPYYFGPFSEVVERDVESLVLSNLIVEQVHSLGFVGPGGIEGRQYTYQLTDDGRQRVGKLREVHEQEFIELQRFINGLISAAGGLDQKILSTAAKTYFIASREDRPLAPEEIGELARQLGWIVNHHQIERVLRVLQKLDLMHPVNSDAN